jgi:hypothetical protein
MYECEERKRELTSAIFARFFIDTIAPAVRTPEDQFADSCMRPGDDALVFSNLKHRLVVVPMLADSPELRTLRHEYAIGAQLDLLAIDLRRLHGPIECQLQLCANRRFETSAFRCDLWIGHDGSVAMVPESPRRMSEGLQPSVLWTPRGLDVAQTHPFITEAEWASGVERAWLALRRAEAIVTLESTVAMGGVL